MNLEKLTLQQARYLYDDCYYKTRNGNESDIIIKLEMLWGIDKLQTKRKEINLNPVTSYKPVKAKPLVLSDEEIDDIIYRKALERDKEYLLNNT